MRNVLIGTAVMAAVLGCRPASRQALDADHAEAMRDSVERMAAAITQDLSREGPLGWLRHFENSAAFFMASDGAVVFPDADSAAAFVRSFAPGIAEMDLEWINMRVEPLAPGVAVLASSYRETLADTAGGRMSFSGYFTAVARHTDAGWRLRNLHWSSPRADQP